MVQFHHEAIAKEHRDAVTMMEAARTGAWGSEQGVSQYRLHHLMIGLAPTPEKAQRNQKSYEKHRNAQQGFWDDSLVKEN